MKYKKTMWIQVGSIDYLFHLEEEFLDYGDNITGLITVPLGEVEKFIRYKKELIKRGFVITKDETLEEQNEK